MAKTRNITVAADKRVSDAERQPTSMSLPAPLHQRLDDLVALARDANTSRTEIVSALVALAEDDADTLVDLVMRYRKLSVGEMFGAPGDDVVVSLHGPGRRKTGAAG